VPILSTAFIGRLPESCFADDVRPLLGAATGPTRSAQTVVIRRHPGLTMRLLVHVLARLAITATSTNSAAALEARIEPRENPSFTSSLSEPLMLNSVKPANAVVGRYSVAAHETRTESRNRRGAAPQQLTPVPPNQEAGANPLPAAMSAMTRATTTWPPVAWFFIEGFALYGASLHAIATDAVTASSSEASDPQPKERSRPEQRNSISLVSSRPGVGMRVLKREGGIDRGVSTTKGQWFPVPEVDRSPRWPAKIRNAIASGWAKWRRERQINKAVTALAELDDRTLRDMGIPHRSQIEQAVRYGRR
jgi:uncharacterized protein YjiS (DUF1127 family)